MARLLCCAGVYTTTVLKRFNLAHKQNYHRMTELWTRYGVGYTAETHNKSQVYRCTHPDFLQVTHYLYGRYCMDCTVYLWALLHKLYCICMSAIAWTVLYLYGHCCINCTVSV